MSEQKPKSLRGAKDPEFMKRMREKAAEKRAQQKKIKDAEKLKEKQEYERKLAEAEQLLNPQPPKQQVMAEEAPPSAPKEAKPPKAEKSVDYKQEYYRHKLELLKEQKSKPPPQSHHDDKPLPHKLLKQQFEQDINKTVMRELWKRHFRETETPYD